MQIFDRKLKKYFPNYILQSLLATITLSIILYFENIFTNTAVVASLGQLLLLSSLCLTTPLLNLERSWEDTSSVSLWESFVFILPL